MHLAKTLVEQFKAGRATANRTDEMEKSKYDSFGEEVPFIGLEAPAGSLIGWVAICAREGAVELMWIEAKKGGEQGRGDRMLKELCGFAYKLGVALTLQAAPLDEPRLDDLNDWYEDNRFVLDAPPRNQTRYQRMTRQPKVSEASFGLCVPSSEPSCGR